MIIHLTNTCDAFNYQTKITVADFKHDGKKNTITIEYNDKLLIVPLSNINCIEEIS